MVKELIKTLKERALGFLHDAKIDLKEGRFDLAAFHVEQFAQLYVKAKILEYGVQFPKTHSLRELLRRLAKLSSKKTLERLSNDKVVYELEEVYITSRYFPFHISEEEAKSYLKFAMKLKREVDKV